MIEFTTDYELTTGLTNVLILLFSIFGLITILNKKWKFFFLCMTLDSFVGSLVHTIVMSEQLYNLLWVFLVIFFVMTIHSLLGIYINMSIKQILLLTITMVLILFIQMIYGINFILTFALYVLLVLLVCLYKIVKNGIKKNIWFFIGFILEIIGGIFMLSKVKIGLINHNGIYHLFVLFNLICFYLGVAYGNKSCCSINRKR